MWIKNSTDRTYLCDCSNAVKKNKNMKHAMLTVRND